MFKKLLFFTDIHFGRKNNDPVALKDNEDFVDWAIEEGKKRGCDTLIFGGDWWDNRLSLNVFALNAGLRSLEKISAAFPASYFILGNHDVAHRDHRSVHSMAFAQHIQNINVISQPTGMGDVTFLPWLMPGEHHSLPSPTKYTFAHLEMSGFMMNAKSIMPESDHCMSADVLADHGTVFTGHFHARQIVGNIVYTGNVMPFDFSDNWDSDRGAMFLDWNGQPEFVSWPGQPLYRTLKLSQLLESKDVSVYLKPKMTARVSVDTELTYEQAQGLKEYYVTTFGLRRLELISEVKPQETTVDEISFQTIDQIVIDGLLSVQSQGMRSDTLVGLYKSLA